MFRHLAFDEPNDLEDVRAKLKDFDGKKIEMRCHYAKISYSDRDDWLRKSEHYVDQTGSLLEEKDNSFTLGGEFCSSKNIDRDIAEMQPHNSEGKPFYKKYVSVQIITTEE